MIASIKKFESLGIDDYFALRGTLFSLALLYFILVVFSLVLVLLRNASSVNIFGLSGSIKAFVIFFPSFYCFFIVSQIKSANLENSKVYFDI